MRPEEIISLQVRMSEYNDQQAFEKLYHHFFSRLLHFACTFTKDRSIAEEIVGDVFVKLWQNRVTVDSIRNLKVYLFVAVRNHALNYLKWKSRDVITYFEVYPENIPVSETTPERLLMTREMESRINRAVDSLPPRCKVIFKMVREDRLKYREVAEVLNISPRTVETQMAIAVKRLTASLSLSTKSY